MSSFAEKVKHLVRQPGYFKTAFFAAAGLPTNHGRVIIEDDAAGLQLLHTANTAAEADMLRQLLTDAGFHVEYIPSASTGIFGTSGNSSIYIRKTEHAEAQAFLSDYYSSDSTAGNGND